MTSPVIVVIGMHRSGTSLCANMLHALGADMSDTNSMAPANAKGHWERHSVVALNDELLGFFRRSWGLGSHILDMPDQWLADPRIPDIRARAMAWLAPGLGTARPLGFKDPRTTVTLPFWQQVFAAVGAVPRYVFCVRDPAQVVRSLHERDGLERAAAEYRWLKYNVDAIRSVAAAQVCIIPYASWFDRSLDTATRLARHVGLPPPLPDAVHSVVDPDLRHDHPVTAQPGPLAGRLHRMIVQAAADDEFTPRLRDFVGLVREFQVQIQPQLTETVVMLAGMNDQRRVIGELQALIGRLRGEPVGSE